MGRKPATNDWRRAEYMGDWQVKSLPVLDDLPEVKNIERDDVIASLSAHQRKVLGL